MTDLTDEEKQILCEKIICELVAEHGNITMREIFEEFEERGLLDEEPDYTLFHPDTVFSRGKNWHKAPRFN